MQLRMVWLVGNSINSVCVLQRYAALLYDEWMHYLLLVVVGKKSATIPAWKKNPTPSVSVVNGSYV
jgi:hypothetical protein